MGEVAPLGEERASDNSGWWGMLMGRGGLKVAGGLTVGEG